MRPAQRKGTYICCEMADSCLQEVVFHRPLHQVVVDGRLAHLLVLLDRLVVVTFDGCQIGNLEVVLIRETGSALSASRTYFHICGA